MISPKSNRNQHINQMMWFPLQERGESTNQNMAYTTKSLHEIHSIYFLVLFLKPRYIMTFIFCFNNIMRWEGIVWSNMEMMLRCIYIYQLSQSDSFNKIKSGKFDSNHSNVDFILNKHIHSSGWGPGSYQLRFLAQHPISFASFFFLNLFFFYICNLKTLDLQKSCL